MRTGIRLGFMVALFLLARSTVGQTPSSRRHYVDSGARQAANVSNRRAEPALAIVDVNLIPMTAEKVVPSQTVIVSGGRIVQILPASTANLPANAVKIDGRGKYLIPGLCDMHVHAYYEEELISYVANGVTTVRNMRGAPFHLGWRSRIASGGMLGPTLYTAGPTLDGPPSLNRFNTVVVTAADGAAAVERQYARGYDFIKVYNNLPREAYTSIVATAKKHHMPVTGHWVRSVGQDLLGSGQADVAHVEEFYYGYFQSKPDATKLDSAASLAAANSMAVTTTLTSIRNIVRLPEGTDNQVLREPEVKFLPPPVVTEWAENPFKGLQSDFVSKNLEMFAFLKQIVKAMQERGVMLMLGTDAHFPSLVGGFSVHEELTVLVEAGLTPYEALTTATRTPGEFIARVLRSKERFGTIEVGSRADLILLTANPLTDIRNTRIVRESWFAEDGFRKPSSMT